MFSDVIAYQEPTVETIALATAFPCEPPDTNRRRTPTPYVRRRKMFAVEAATALTLVISSLMLYAAGTPSD